MLADNKITRGSTGISLHWGTSYLIVLTIIVSMLGMTQFALAEDSPHHYEPNRTLPPPDCPGYCPSPHYFLNRGFSYGMEYVNQAVVNKIPLVIDQIYNQAIASNNTYGETGYDGTAWVITNTVKQYQTQIVNTTPTITPAIYKYFTANGFKGTQAQLQSWVQSTKAQRQTMVNDIVANNLLYRMQQYAVNMNDVGNEVGGLFHQHPQLMNASWRLQKVNKASPQQCANLNWMASMYLIIGVGILTFVTAGTDLYVFGGWLVLGGTVWQNGVSQIVCGA
jgi:hypothetical protein